MKKSVIISFISGALIFGTVGAFAGQYVATENPFPVQLNGNNVSIEGYNIEGSTYFKLRDIANIIGGFDVGFADDTIQLSKDGYKYSSENTYDDNGLAYDIVEGNGSKYYVLKNKPTAFAMANVCGKTSLIIYEDTQGTKYVSLSEVSSIATKAGFFCDVFPSKVGTWDFKEYKSDSYETVSSGTLFVDSDIDDFYILLDDYNEKVAPTLEKYVEKYYI